MPEIRRFYQPVDFNDALTKGGVAIPTISSTSTLTNKTLTSPTITSPTITGATISASIAGDVKVLAADLAMATNVVLATLTGFSWSVIAGATYALTVEGATTMSTNGGLSMALKLTTATLTALQAQAVQAVTSTVAYGANFTTATDQAKIVDNKTAAYTYLRIQGAIIVNAAGTIGLQACQNTSHSDTTTLLKGFTASLIRTS